ncbi:MAG: NAD(P)-binding domain-containing protein, partial [bacterium]|nr:NAD(P)-binding domain-containing protein [bacterium]
MGLIRNGIEQGKQAIDSIRAKADHGTGDAVDVLIVGAGPAGLSATLAANKHGLRYRTIEQEALGGTAAHSPRGKIVMTAPVDLPGYGKVKLRETTKEALLELWEKVIKQTGVEIRYAERVEAVERTGNLFEVRTNRGTHSTKTVLLAIGRRGTPRKLGVPGEEMDKVVYRLIDPMQYRDMAVLVVGGGDSALEAAETISQEPGTRVVLSYRGASFSRAKAKNRKKVEAAEGRGDLQVHLESNVSEIRKRAVVLQLKNESVEIENDAVLVCAGGILPTTFLKEIGIEIETRRGEVRP